MRTDEKGKWVIDFPQVDVQYDFHFVKDGYEKVDYSIRTQAPGQFEGLPRRRAALDAMLADILLVHPAVDLVARRRLPRQPHRPVLPRAVVDSLLREIRIVGPLGGIAGILVHENIGDILAVALITGCAEEPQAITDDGAAQRWVQVPELLQRAVHRQALSLQLGRDVVSLKGAPRDVHEKAPGERIASLLPDDVHLGAAGHRLTETAADAEGHFLLVGDLRDVRGDAHSLKTGALSIDEDLPLVPASAVDLKHAEDWPQRAADVVALRVDRGNELRVGEVLPRGRNIGHCVAAQRLLGARAGHVDDRRFAGDGDRLCDAAHAQFRIHVGDEGASQLDPFALETRESGQRECDRVGARSKVLNRVLTGSTGDNRARFLDQRGARRLHGNARQHRARRIPDRTYDRRLRVRGCRGDNRRDEHECLDPSQHDEPPSSHISHLCLTATDRSASVRLASIVV